MALLVFPLTFVSSAYVPVSSMPGWMRPIAEHQPVTVLVDTVRSLTLGHGAGDHLTAALLWCAGLVAAFAPLAVARFRRG
jgi:ABC-type multidrug transport system permease subunit